jgi:hypothetical protein
MYSGTKPYVDYKGGAGPEEEQSINNDKALSMALELNKIPFTWTDELAYTLWDGDDQQMKIIRPNGDKIYVSYDRWGFVIDGMDCDQESLKTTLEYIKDWWEGKLAGNIDVNIRKREDDDE